ncbi:MAG: hypothetical protein P4N41_21140 [Negativicutes bacterium]|nr:hypothetical protein [Negativicutes bacterium]
MKKLIALCVFALLMVSASQAFANLDDNRASMAAKYGDYRLVVDRDSHLWTKADWEAGGSAKAKASAYVYYFTRNSLNMQMEVQYAGNDPDARVVMQRITPDSEIKIQDFKKYFPEVCALIVDPKAMVFTTTKDLTRNFRADHSPVTMGVFVNGIPAAKVRTSTLMAFNVQNAGEMIKDPTNISKDSYIHEFTIERIIPFDSDDTGGVQRDWKKLKSPLF